MGYKSPRYLTQTIACANQAALTDAVVLYFSGNSASAPDTDATVYAGVVHKSGIIRGIGFVSYCATAGSNEAWEMYIRINNTTDYLISSVSAITNRRTWSNDNLNIPVVQGDTWVIKSVAPTWGTNPANFKAWGYVLYECE